MRRNAGLPRPPPPPPDGGHPGLIASAKGSGSAKGSAMSAESQTPAHSGTSRIPVRAQEDKLAPTEGKGDHLDRFSRSQSQVAPHESVPRPR